MSKQNMDIAAFVGLDWADQQHVVCLKQAGREHRETFPLDQTPEALQSWIQQLRSRFGGRPVAIAVEQARGALIYALMHVEFLHLYPVNPQTLAKLRKDFYNCSNSRALLPSRKEVVSPIGFIGVWPVRNSCDRAFTNSPDNP